MWIAMCRTERLRRYRAGTIASAARIGGAILLALSAPVAVSSSASCAAHFEAVPSLLSLESPGLPALPSGATATHAWFGRTLTVGDFNNDGADDLVVAHQQGSAIGVTGARGSVLVLPGGSAGPGTASALRLTGEAVEADGPRGFGEALAAADFDGDGYDDLAVGAFGMGFPVAGKVYVYRGSESGIDPASVQAWDRDVAGISGPAGDEDGFGMQLVAGRFDSDRFDDLAIAAMKGFDTPALHQGVVYVLFGTAQGLTAEGNVGLQYVPAGSPPLDIHPRVAIDSNGDDVDELIVTFSPSLHTPAPYACLGHDLRAPLPAWSCFGKHSFDSTAINYDPGGFTVGNFDGDGIDELIGGENGYSQDPLHGSGRSRRWRGLGSGVGIVEPEAQFVAPSFELPYVNNGRFGSNHAAADFDGDGFTDLAVGESGWSDATVPAQSGRLHVFAGGPDGLGPSAAQHVSAEAVAAVLEPQPDLRLGNVLAAGDFDADGCVELALGTPSRDTPGHTDSGAVVILDNVPSPLFGDGFEL
jgi:hypothetical protein